MWQILVGGLILLAEQGLACEAYNVSSGRSISVTEMARALIAELGLTDRTRLTYTGSSWPGDAQRGKFRSPRSAGWVMLHRSGSKRGWRAPSVGSSRLRTRTAQLAPDKNENTVVSQRDPAMSLVPEGKSLESGG